MTIFICILHQGKWNDGRLPRLFLEAGRYYDLLQDDVADVLAEGGLLIGRKIYDQTQRV